MSQAMRKLTAAISKTNCVAIFINQVREKIGVLYGNPETTPGGRALKFYASVRISVSRGEPIKDGSELLGYRTKCKVVKNKVAPPFKTAEFDMFFGEGISKAGEVIDLAVEHGVVKKAGAWFSYNGSKLGQGRDAVKKVIADNPELMEELEQKIVAKLNEKKAKQGGKVNPFLPSNGTTLSDKDEEVREDDALDELPDTGGESNADLFGDDFEIDIEE